MSNIIIVDKTGTLKSSLVKEFSEGDLYKKCGFKKSEGFAKQTEWAVKLEGKKYHLSVYAKTEGKANGENKYDFPPPIDNTLFFGSCAIVCYLNNSDGEKKIENLTIELWNKVYEKLFGGFEDLAATCLEDEEEEDELDNIPDSKKTKHGYLKDGFVVDTSESDEENCSVASGSDFEEGEMSEEDTESTSEDVLNLEDIGSELAEEDYDE